MAGAVLRSEGVATVKHAPVVKGNEVTRPESEEVSILLPHLLGHKEGAKGVVSTVVWLNKLLLYTQRALERRCPVAGSDLPQVVGVNVRALVEHADGKLTVDVVFLKGSRNGAQDLKMVRVSNFEFLRDSMSINERAVTALYTLIEEKAVEKLHSRRRFVIRKIHMRFQCLIGVRNIDWLRHRLNMESLSINGVRAFSHLICHLLHSVLFRRGIAHHAKTMLLQF
mmetsp:Transcript_17748/g.35002  ORF Transcript_17748/g.35002 Transcript_17748/m.35002 type:complete len:225 (+) Transcript_17748:773-1447(+)